MYHFSPPLYPAKSTTQHSRSSDSCIPDQTNKTSRSPPPVGLFRMAEHRIKVKDEHNSVARRRIQPQVREGSKVLPTKFLLCSAVSRSGCPQNGRFSPARPPVRTKCSNRVLNRGDEVGRHCFCAFHPAGPHPEVGPLMVLLCGGWLG